MANHGCVNGTLDSANYSSPVPVIGLYVAAASLVCMLLMLYDIVAGFRARQIWLPCKFFTINSVTFILLSIAAKLPVDLTTPMPSPDDQLSKLSGTTLIVISMGFFMPSIGVNNETECFMNMVAMTIFVITIFVNISIQISSGVIILFIAEHITILSCMLVLLMMMWFSVWDINNRKRISIYHNKEILAKDNGSMFERLKTSYLFGYCSNPQLVLCINPTCLVSSIICPICSFILIYNGFRTLILKQLKFCLGNSDYDWSMSIIVVIQILAVVVGSFAIIFRFLAMFKYNDFNYLADLVDLEADNVIDKNPILGIVSTVAKYGRALLNLYLIVVVCVQIFIVCVPSDFIYIFCMLTFDNFDPGSKKWTERKSMEDMKIWLEASKSRCPNHLSQLFSRTHPSQQLHTIEIKDQAHPNREGVKVSSLSIVLLVRIAQVISPDSLCGSLVQAFSEASEIIHFIGKTINPKSLENDNKLVYAKAVWAGNGFSCLLPKIFDTSTNQFQYDLDRAVSIIENLKNTLPKDTVRDELEIITKFINRKTYSSIEELYDSIEQIFVDMVHMLLVQLPNAIFKFLNDSTTEDYEESVKLALKFICKFESMEAQIQWLFPVGCNISRLITNDISEEDNV